MSRRKPVEQASACLHLNFAALAKFKTKQAEACSTGVARDDSDDRYANGFFSQSVKPRSTKTIPGIVSNVAFVARTNRSWQS